jgi:hypothetical protein
LLFAQPCLLLFLLAFLVNGGAALLQPHPGYMDAAYSYDMALNLARGEGLWEPFLWNYLDDPAGLPHPSHLYWMPLPTLLAWIGLKLFGESYRSAQAPFVCLSAVLPLVSYYVALQVTGRRRHAWLAGLLTVFSGFYVLYWGHTDNFTPFALAGSLSLAAAWQAGRRHERHGFRRAAAWGLAAGVLAGLAHLARADGPLLLLAIGAMWLPSIFPSRRSRQADGHWGLLLGVLAVVALGYGLVVLPWFARNWSVAGQPLPAGGAQTIWLTTYDDLFAYGRELSPRTYLAWGWDNILRSKLNALWLNLQTVLAVLCMVFLAPLALAGGWRLRRHPLIQLAAWYGVLLLAAMTLVFTFPGPRGGLFHSGGALLPFIFTAGAAGLDAGIQWAAARRPGWDPGMAQRVFGAGLVALAVLVTGLLGYRAAVAGTRWQQPSAYQYLVEWLAARDQLGAVVMVGDPPGYRYHGGGPSIVVPNEPPERVLAAADRYGARYLVLDRNRPAPLAALFSEETAHPRLSLVGSLNGGLRIYRIQPSEVSR